MGSTHEFAFGQDPSEVHQARQRVRDWLAGHGRRDDAVLAVSELVTNALEHTRQAGGVLRVNVTGDAATVSVVDGGGTERPVPREPQATETGGRGLQIVQEIGDDWGVCPVKGGGTRVWVRFLDLPLATED
jgi:anti-sigma regulatory factor (Ser/Thr protein kinase)